MTYIDYIESSTTWRCPKSGLWKIICVGGGASGGYSFAADTRNKPVQSEGGSTVFGDILTVKGGGKCLYHDENSNAPKSVIVSGHTGYNMMSYGKIYEAHSFFSKEKHEYGAGGDAQIVLNVASNCRALGVPGLAGQIKVTVADLEQDQSISCTIGAGGKVTAAITKEKLEAAAKKYKGDISEFEYDLESAQASCTDGNDGVIIVQYLGANI